MKSVKKIIWIAWDFWFFEKNKKIFQDLNILVIQIKWEEDLEKCDWVFFWTSSFFQLKNYFSDNFLNLISIKIEENFPVLFFWQSVNLFIDKIWFKNNSWIFTKEWKTVDESCEITLDFLDSKVVKIKNYKNFYYSENKINIFKKIFTKILKLFWFKKNDDDLILKNWEDLSWNNTVLTYKKTLFVIFSPEIYWDRRIYEYFVNDFF